MSQNDSPLPDPDTITSPTFNDDSQINAFSPFTMVFVGVAYVVIVIYFVRFVIARLRNIVMRGSLTRGEGLDANGNRIETQSIRSESLPSFFKVIVLPDKDVCYGIENEYSHRSDSETIANQKRLRRQLIGKMGGNTSDADLTSNVGEDSSIRLFKAPSVNLESDAGSDVLAPENTQQEFDQELDSNTSNPYPIQQTNEASTSQDIEVVYVDVIDDAVTEDVDVSNEHVAHVDDQSSKDNSHFEDVEKQESFRKVETSQEPVAKDQ
eukprot:TRINITY_DN7426_c0_g2_i2.p1 TRINITY_DN7426_c0_g2~~TRINITY_DN7426_c0_g2_i2.p1  ORF type:complete len:286 (-),score=36.48 TRINITY_DN7426_c0_g2_i2:284-1081(-)